MRLRCKEIYMEDGCIDGILVVENGIIKEILPQKEPYDLDVSEMRILPGMMDVHTHGFMSYTAQSCDPENYRQLSQVMASQGICGFLTTAGEHHGKEMEELHTIAEVMKEEPKGARILGIHMEGPFINPNKKGAFSEDQLLDIDFEKMKAYIEAAQHQIRYITIAPELDPSGSFLHFLKQQGIRVAGGHTICNHAQYQQAIAYGLDASTHTGNAMSQIDRRDVNALGTALLDRGLYAEMICDLIHIAKEMLAIYLRVKPWNRLMVISDTGPLSGLPAGRYRIHEQERLLDEEGRITLCDGTIAGSSRSMIWGMKNLVEQLGVPIADVIRMTSLNQATFLGIREQKGSLRVGKDADFIVVDSNFQVQRTYVEGRLAYQRGKTILPTVGKGIEKIA